MVCYLDRFRGSFGYCVVMVLKIKFFFTILTFLFTALLFSTLYDGARNANITDTGVRNTVQILPFIIVVFMAVIPIYIFVEERAT